MELLKKLVDILYPKRCPVCDEVLGNDNLIHNICRTKLNYINQDIVCLNCGRLSEVKDICNDCQSQEKSFNFGRSIFIYDNTMKLIIHRFKYSGKKEYSEFLGFELAKMYKKMNFDVDFIVPVPIHKNRYKKRGYNQSECLVIEMCKYLNINYIKDIIIRSKDTLPQKNLTKNERQKNLYNSIIPSNIDLKNKKVLLIDDVYTTGATIDSCAKILKNMGADKVYFLTLAS